MLWFCWINARTLPDDVREHLTKGAKILIFLMPGYGTPDKPITDKMRRDCFTCDLGAGPFDILPLWKHGGGYYGQFDGRRDKGLLAEAVGAIYTGDKLVYKRRAWQNQAKLNPGEIKTIISNSI